MSPAIPRLLQRPHTPDEKRRAARPPSATATGTGTGTGDGAQTDKGDRRTDVPAPKPNEEHEVGDLERSEREDHGQADKPH